MAAVRYSVPGVPAGPAAGLSAFTPPFQPYCASGHQAYKYGLFGAPGTYGAPAPTRDTVPSPDRGDKALYGTSASAYAPDAYYRAQYYQEVIAERPGAGMPVQVYSPAQPGLTTLLPVPAADYRARYQADSARLSRRAILNRVRQLPWFPRMYSAPDA